MAKKEKDSNKVIADLAKQNAELKKKARAKEASQSSAMEDQVDIASQLVKLQNEYNSSLEQARKVQNNIKNLDAEIMRSKDLILKNATKYNKQTKEALGAQIKELKFQKEQAKNLSKALVTRAKIAKIEAAAAPHRKQLVESQKKLNHLQEKYVESFEENLKFVDKITEAVEEIPVVGGIISKALGLDTLKDELAEKLSGQFAKAIDSTSAKQEKAAAAAVKGYDDQIDALNDSHEVSEEITETTDKTAEATEGATKETKKFKMGLGATLGVAGALFAVVELFKGALEVDQELTDMSRELGISRHEAHELHHNLLATASTTKVIGANSKALHESMMDLVAVTGQNNVQNQEMLEAQVLLKKQYGLAAEEATALQTVSVAGGKTTYQNLATIETMTKEYNKMTGDSLNFKEITKDIAKVSKATLASYHGDVKALTLAAIQAKKIGMSMDQTAKVAENLLDIESSIENEMKANVLTGKHMNMNKARELALAGKSAEAAAEAVKQAGDYDEFMKMGPIQQRAIAEAAGMTVEELTKAGELRKMSAALGGKEIKDMSELSAQDRERLVASGDISEEKAKELAIQQQQASVNEKMSAIVDRIKASFAEIASGPLGTIASLMASVLENGAALTLVLGGAAVAATALALPMITAAIAAMTTASAVTLGIGIAAVTAGLIVGAATMDDATDSAAQKLDDGMIDSKGGLVVKGKEGTYQLNENDSIIAGTDLDNPSSGGDSGLLGSIASGVGNFVDSVTGQSDANMIALLQEQNSLMNKLLTAVSQPTVIKFGSKTIEEFESQINMKKSYTSQIDRGYGATS